MAGGMAALVDMWKLAGTGGTPRCTVKDVRAQKLPTHRFF